MQAGRFFIYAEDDPDALILMRAALKKLKSDGLLMHCPDGEALIACLPASADSVEKLAFILLDLRMPRMDGFEALRRIQKTPGLEVLPVIIWSSSPMEADIQLATALGATDYIVKPGSFRELVEKVEELLARFHVGTSDRS